MRSLQLIEDGNPCDVDFTDKSIQTISDVKSKGVVLCSNLEQCQKRSAKEEIQCSLRVAQQMAGFLMREKSDLCKAVEEERQDYLKNAPSGKFWVRRNGKWLVVKGKKNVIDDIVAFALIIIDRRDGERRPFTNDGKRIPELGLDDVMHNVVLDLADIGSEVKGE